MRYNTCPPSYPPPKGGRRIKGIGRFLLAALKNDRFSYLFIPDFFHIGSVTWEFIRYFGDIKATLYIYGSSCAEIYN